MSARVTLVAEDILDPLVLKFEEDCFLITYFF